MLPRHRSCLNRACLLATATVMLLSCALPRAAAATEAVEMPIDNSGEEGKLKPLPRSTTPVVESASDEGLQAIANMKLPPGFKAELWAAEPMLANPVAFNLDHRGRVFVAETHRYGSSTLDIRDYMWLLEDDLDNRTKEDFLDMVRRRFGEEGTRELSQESERVVLIEDANGDGVADKSSVYADNFRTPIDGVAGGVLPYRGDVWFTNIPSLWKLSGRDRAEKRQEMFTGFGLRFNFTGHDLHGLILGPDGRIYFSVGDRAAHVKTREGGEIAAPDTGSVFRCWPDGSFLELFATGLRNPQSLLFNEYGDLFTGDNDSDQGDQERLVHLVQDGTSGWCVGYQFAPRGDAGPWNAEKMWLPRNAAQSAFHLAPICNIEDGPSGIAYYPGTGLGPGYERTIFITHFKGSIANSGIYAYKLKPSGASYAIDTAEPFLTGALPTDVRFGPNGKMYYSDWAEGWPKSRKGRIYTIANPETVNTAAVKEVAALLASDFTPKSDDALLGLLAHADWRVRLEAQYTLAERGAKGVAAFSKAVAGANELARRHGVWGLGQIGSKDAGALPALRPLLAHADSEVRAQAAKTLGDLRDSDSDDVLVKMLADEGPRVRFFAAQALGKLKHAAATPALLAAVRANKNDDPYLRHALVMGLAGCATPRQLAATGKDDSPAVRLAAVLALRRQGAAQVVDFLSDTDQTVRHEAVIAINDAPIASGYAAVAAILAKPVDDEPVMLRALNAAFRLGTDEQAAMLADFAAKEGPAVLRQEALQLLALWPSPPARDRIVGIYRPLPDKSRPVESVSRRLAPALKSLLALPTPDSVQEAAITAAVSLKLAGALPDLRAVVADAGHSVKVRVAALRGLDKLDDPELAATAEQAVRSELPELRLAALPIYTRVRPDGAVPTLTDLLSRGTAKEQQTAFLALGAVADPAADAVLLEKLAQLAAGKVTPAAQLELLEAAGKRQDPRVKQALADREAAIAKTGDPLAPFRVCLEGGDAEEAMDIFNYNPILQCARCHRTGNAPGGEAGPNLAGIALRGTREYILESIIKPSAKIAPGFETVTVTKTDGQAVVGRLVERSAAGVRLHSADAIVDIPATSVKQVESAPSAMPEVAALVLTKGEIRDLVEGLSRLDRPARDTEKRLRAFQHLSGGPIESDDED